MFSEKKAAQMAAFLLNKAGGTLHVIVLTKLLYLTERKSMAQFGLPICGDLMVSMPYGPVLSKTLDLTNGNVNSPIWDALIEAREHHLVKLHNQMDRESLSSLSDADVFALEAVWAEFGSYEKWALVDYTHDKCEEWEDPQGSSSPIPLKRVFRAVGMTQEAADVLAAEASEQNRFDSIFAGEGSRVAVQ